MSRLYVISLVDSMLGRASVVGKGSLKRPSALLWACVDLYFIS